MLLCGGYVVFGNLCWVSFDIQSFPRGTVPHAQWPLFHLRLTWVLLLTVWQVNRLGNQLDYLGIVALIWGSMVPSVYYGFYCELMLQRTYWTMVCPSHPHHLPPTTEIKASDLSHRHGLLLGLYKSQVQNAFVETFSSEHVCRIWPVCRIPGLPRIRAVRT